MASYELIAKAAQLDTKGNAMDRKLLVTAICAALVVPWTPVAFAQDAAADATPQQTEQAPQEATELDKVIVTGSRIPRTSSRPRRR